MKIQRKVIYVFSMAFIALVSLSLYSYYNTRLGSRSAAMVSHTQDVLDNIQQVLTINADMENAARGYELTVDSKYKDECYTSSILVNKQLQKLEVLVRDNPIQEQRVNELTELINEKIRFLYNTMETRDKSLEENYKRIQLASGNKLADKIKVKVSQMQDEENRLLADRVAENQSAIRSSVITIMLGCSLAFAFGLWALYRLNADMNKTQIAEVAAKQSEKKYRTLIEDAADVVFRCDYAGNFTFINHRTLELTGYTEDELIGKHFTFLVVPEMIENVGAFYKKQFKEMNRETILEFKVACKDGSRKWVEQTVVMIKNGEKIDGFQCIVRDVSIRKQLEAQLVAAKEEAEEATKAKEMFLASMSHEIRTPMNGVIGMANLLESTQLTAEQKEYVGGIIGSSERLLTIINDILDLSKINAGRITFEKEPFNIRELVKSITMNLGITAKKKNISLNTQIDDAVPEYIAGDSVRLSQILWNLAGNAVKFTEKGGVDIYLSAKSLEDENIDIEFKIKDSGIGITEEKLPHIFQPFVQADIHTTRKYGGTGLGLDIAKKLVELQGGNITVESTPGEGSTFSFHIGFAKMAESKLAGEIKETEGKKKDLKGLKVLFVEDNKVNQRVGERTLVKWSAIVTIAENGRKAVQMLSANTYDLILMDLQMPEMDGIEATRYIRTEMTDTVSKIPIIAMTASAFRSEYDKCIEAGMNDYISKPFKLEELYQAILKATQVGKAA